MQRGLLVFFWLVLSSLIAIGQTTARVYTVQDFAQDKVERGTGDETLTFTVKIHPALPPYILRLVPSAETKVNWDELHSVGHIEILKAEATQPLQIIPVTSFGDTRMFQQHFKFEDINFDGYADIGTMREFGSKWGSYDYRLFDKASGKFVTNQLTQELARLAGNDIIPDTTTKTIHVNYLNLGTQLPHWTVRSNRYRIINQHLYLVERDLFAFKNLNGENERTRTEKLRQRVRVQPEVR